MKILAVLLCLITFNLFAQEQEFNQILSIKNVHVLGMTDICSYLSVEEHESSICSFSLKSLAFSNSQLEKRAVYYETQNVSIQNKGGYNFHIADYYDGSRVVTCLDGELRGLQGIAINGVKVVESTNVEWYKNYFVHRYPNGSIHSYPNKQVAQLN